MGFKFKVDGVEQEDGSVKGQYVAPTQGNHASSGNAGSSGYSSMPAYNETSYFKDIIWNQGQKISDLENENRMLRLQLDQIKNVLGV